MIVSVMGGYIARAYKPPYPSRADYKELKNISLFYIINGTTNYN